MDAPKFTLDDTRTQAATPSTDDATQARLQPAPVVAEQATSVKGQAAPAAPGGPAGLGGDDWSLMDVDPISTETPKTLEVSSTPVSGVTDALHLNKGAPNKNLIYGLGGLAVVAVAALLLLPSEPEVELPPPVARKPKVEAPVVAEAPVVTSMTNPYWGLPNVKPAALPAERAWTTQDEEIYRAGMSHRFNYQHYKTVLSVREKRLAGSEAILSEAIAEPKLWTRMQAAFGLVEMGVDVDVAMARRVVADAKSSQLYNYLKRFNRKPAPSELYMLRHLVRLTDERTRLLILQILHNQKDPLAGLYMTAGSYDPGPKVSTWAKEMLAANTFAPADIEHFQRVVAGTEKFRGLAAIPAAPVAETPNATKAAEVHTEYTVEKIAGDTGAVEDDVQDVEFFNEVKDEETLRENPDDGFDELKETIHEKSGKAI